MTREDLGSPRCNAWDALVALLKKIHLASVFGLSLILGVTGGARVRTDSRVGCVNRSDFAGLRSYPHVKNCCEIFWNGVRIRPWEWPPPP